MSQSPDAPLADAPTREATLPELGTYYRRESSPGFLSRISIAAIDAGVLLAAAGGVLSLLHVLTPNIPSRIESLIILIIGWLYLVALKRTRLGTLGYLIFRVRIVDLKNRAPSLIRLTLRLIVSLGFNPILDLVWLASENSRQGLRDKLCGTYVVKGRRLRPARGN